MARAKFYLCKHCGNLVTMIEDSGVNPVCCGEPMQELKPDTNDAKHLPYFKKQGDKVTVTVGDEKHPMSAENSILWICLETTKGLLIKYLQQEYVSKSDTPKAIFYIIDEEPFATYCCSNQHNLWMVESK